MSLIIIFFRISFKPWISLRQTNESRLDLSTLFSFWNTHLAIFFCASIFQNTGVRSSSFSEWSALNSSFVSTVISSSCSHHLSFALMIETHCSCLKPRQILDSQRLVSNFCFVLLMNILRFCFKFSKFNLRLSLEVLRLSLFLSLYVSLLSPFTIQIHFQGNCCRCLLEESGLAGILPHSRHIHSGPASLLLWNEGSGMRESENWAVLTVTLNTKECLTRDPLHSMGTSVKHGKLKSQWCDVVLNSVKPYWSR